MVYKRIRATEKATRLNTNQTKWSLDQGHGAKQKGKKNLKQEKNIFTIRDYVLYLFED